MNLQLLRVTDAVDWETVRALLREYAAALGFDLGFQHFEEELRDLPAHYGPPQGCLLLAYVDGQLAGCGALRPLTPDVCEMKRLYVRPTVRGLGLGRHLVAALLEEGRQRGYQRMRLDTHPTMIAAQQLYRSFGFQTIAPSGQYPHPGVLFFERALDEPLAPEVSGRSLSAAPQQGDGMDRSLIDKYEQCGVVLRQAVAGLTPEELRARPGPGKWSILELVIHLVDSDGIAIDRMKRMLIEENPQLLYADETAYVDLLHPHEQSLADALDIFEIGRRQWARVLRLLPDAAFARHGTHNRRGRVTVGHMVTEYIEHVDYHLKFLYEKRQRMNRPCA